MTLRDDLVFFIFLYQRHLYPIDAKRADEFGFVYGDEAGEKKKKKGEEGAAAAKRIQRAWRRQRKEVGNDGGGDDGGRDDGTAGSEVASGLRRRTARKQVEDSAP